MLEKRSSVAMAKIFYTTSYVKFKIVLFLQVLVQPNHDSPGVSMTVNSLPVTPVVIDRGSSSSAEEDSLYHLQQPRRRGQRRPQTTGRSRRGIEKHSVVSRPDADGVSVANTTGTANLEAKLAQLNNFLTSNI